MKLSTGVEISMQMGLLIVAGARIVISAKRRVDSRSMLVRTSQQYVHSRVLQLRMCGSCIEFVLLFNPVSGQLRLVKARYVVA